MSESMETCCKKCKHKKDCDNQCGVPLKEECEGECFECDMFTVKE